MNVAGMWNRFRRWVTQADRREEYIECSVQSDMTTARLAVLYYQDEVQRGSEDPEGAALQRLEKRTRQLYADRPELGL